MKKYEKELKNYPQLYGAISRFIKNNGKSEQEGHIPDFVYFFKKLYYACGIDPDELFGWDEETSEDFWSWGHNSRWAHTAWSWIESNTDECIKTALKYAKKFGDIDLDD